jgi:hypothetical protein
VNPELAQHIPSFAHAFAFISLSFGGVLHGSNYAVTCHLIVAHLTKSNVLDAQRQVKAADFAFLR